jgi:hypothetical protein
MSAQSATIGFGGSVVRRSHLIAVAILLVVAVAAGVIAGRATSVTTTTRSPSMVLPVSGLAHAGVGSRVVPAMNQLTPAATLDASTTTEHLSGYSLALRAASGRA